MKTAKHPLSTLIAKALVIATFGLSASAFALNSNDKRTESAKLEWVSPDSNHQVTLYRVLDKSSTSYVAVHLDISCGSKASSSITVNGCSGESNLSLMPGESLECVVKSTTPLTAVSTNADSACGFAQFLAKASPK